MKTYKVTITETLEMEVEVEANSQLDAEKLIKDKWNSAEYVLDSTNYTGVEFHAEPKQQRTKDYER